MARRIEVVAPGIRCLQPVAWVQLLCRLAIHAEPVDSRAKLLSGGESCPARSPKERKQGSWNFRQSVASCCCLCLSKSIVEMLRLGAAPSKAATGMSHKGVARSYRQISAATHARNKQGQLCSSAATLPQAGREVNAYGTSRCQFCTYLT